MEVGELLMEIGRCGVSLRARRIEDRLHYHPSGELTPELAGELKKHKAKIIEIMREDERLREDRRLEETGIIQSERQVFEIVRAYFAGRNTARGT